MIHAKSGWIIHKERNVFGEKDPRRYIWERDERHFMNSGELRWRTTPFGGGIPPPLGFIDWFELVLLATAVFKIRNEMRLIFKSIASLMQRVVLGGVVKKREKKIRNGLTSDRRRTISQLPANEKEKKTILLRGSWIVRGWMKTVARENGVSLNVPFQRAWRPLEGRGSERRRRRGPWPRPGLLCTCPHARRPPQGPGHIMDAGIRRQDARVEKQRAAATNCDGDQPTPLSGSRLSNGGSGTRTKSHRRQQRMQSILPALGRQAAEGAVGGGHPHHPPSCSPPRALPARQQWRWGGRPK